jgi:hypothetical protein
MSESSKSPSVDDITLEDFYRYFARWESAFPSGIPEEYVEEGVVSDSPERSVASVHSQDSERVVEATVGEESPSPAAPRPHLRFGGSLPLKGVFFHCGEPLAEKEIALFQAAVEKGLQWHMNECLLVDEQSAVDYSVLARDERLLGGEPKVMILGAPSASLKRFLSSMKGHFAAPLETVTLRTVLNEPAKKRLFWEDLQKLLEPQ